MTENLYLNMVINKSNTGKTDKDGNYYFVVEASNENLDLDNQRVLQNALMNSKHYFETNGVISDDHLHKTEDKDGNIITHTERIIGEPVEIWTEGSKTFVKGKLYSNNQYAREYINLLKANSTRIHASVGGIRPKVVRNLDGTETITDFKWNDLALTCSPVNDTVGSARFAKSLTSEQFCKALYAGTGADSSTFTGGRALQKEDIEKNTTSIIADSEVSNVKKEVINEAKRKVENGEIDSDKKIIDFLLNNDFSISEAKTAINEIKDGIMKKSFFDTMAALRKSITGKSCKKCDDKDAEKVEKSEDDEDVNLDDENTEDSENTSDDDDSMDLFDDEEDSNDDEEDSENEDDEVKKHVKKSTSDDEMVDASEVFANMNAEIANLKNENKMLQKSLTKMRDEITSTQKEVCDFAKCVNDYMETPQIRKSVVATRHNATANADGNVNVKPSADDFAVFQRAIRKSIANKAIGATEVTVLTSQFQKSMRGEKIPMSDWKEICRIVNENK